VLLLVKAANLQELMQANIVFFPAGPDLAKPFVAETELTNGHMNIIIPPGVDTN